MHVVVVGGVGLIGVHFVNRLFAGHEAGLEHHVGVITALNSGVITGTVRPD